MAQNNNYELPLNWQQKVSLWFGELKVHLYQDRVLYYYCIAATSILYLSSLYLNSPIDYSFTTYLETLALAFYVTFLSCCLYYYFYLIIKKEKRPSRQFFTKLKQIFLPLSRTVSVFILMLCMNLVFSNHTFLKSLIPSIHPFSLDNALANIDKLLHFGIAPWELTHSLLPSAWASWVINIAYNAWFFFMWGVLIFFLIYKKQPLLRQQFLLTFVFSWLFIGAFFATLLSSAGPCFLELLNGDNQFAPLMNTLNQQSEYLQSVEAGPLWALPTQDYLWEGYIEPSNNIGAGISAMPSMHVSIAVLLALSLYRVNRILGYFAYAFAVLTQIGSVHLAWHYAVDGYMSIILTVLLWKLVGRFIKRFPTLFQ
ncbi:phosphatase PAP2 family protein [Vibrio campbellii]|uniref:phosphatase PAP2 family protein n=1 Tax=Vibrio campbellii TaxID=680 RepID=UPI0005F03A8A|nr:phosphatase PAP2 family protein [Vibrio campbellii]